MTRVDPWLRTVVLLALAGGAADAQTTTRVSVDSGGAQADGPSGIANGTPMLAVSANGRYVAFASRATNLVAADTNAAWDVFVHDRQTGSTERVSLGSAGAQGNADSQSPSISADGRYVAFDSAATNLVAGDTNAAWDVFVRDRQTGATERVSVDSAGAQGNFHSRGPSISPDGGAVAFSSAADDLVAGDSNGYSDVFVHDRQSGGTARVSVDSAGVEGNGDSFQPSISAAPNLIAFASFATNLSPSPAGYTQIFVHDRLNGTTAPVSLSGPGGTLPAAFCETPSISYDGSVVAYWQSAFPGGGFGVSHVYLFDAASGTTELVDKSSGGVSGNANAAHTPAVPAKGRYVLFASGADNLVAGDAGAGTLDVFLRDRVTATTRIVSVASNGAHGGSHSNGGVISADLGTIVFVSQATNLVPGDTNGAFDVFVHDRTAARFTSLCDPGIAGVIACPCANAPAGVERGCDNSSTTGGASLVAGGGASLATDSLVFTTSRQRPTALCLLLQGTTSPAAGLVYGQGVRCVGGVLKRLFSRSASGGSVTMPDFSIGEPTVSARSAAKGDPILPGQNRFYLAFYRDPIVLGSCPATSTFNATQSGRIAWQP